MIKIHDIELEHINYVAAIKKDFTIAYLSRFEMGEEVETEEIDVRGKNFFDIYPGYDFANSALAKCMSTGQITSSLNDTYKDYKGKIHCTDGIAFPIIKKGEIIGAIELSRDRTTVKNIRNKNISENKSHGKTDDSEEIIYNEEPFSSIFTQNEKMKAQIERAKLFSGSKSNTLIYGETGTGKELFAQAMIRYGGYPQEKVVVHNCASVPENLAESILFGAEKGAYTGAEKRNGLFYEANGGVFFLDELNSLPYKVQGKLLRVLQDGKYRPVGSNREVDVDVRIIATMNTDPMEAIKRHELRADLFYRLCNNMISVIPLRERKDDIIPTAYYLIEKYNKIFGKEVRAMSPSLEEFFLSYSWDGNVRELKNTIESMVFATKTDVLTEDGLPGYMYDSFFMLHQPEHEEAGPPQELPVCDEVSDNQSLKSILERTEREVILRTLKDVDWNISEASRVLEIPRQTLQYRIDKLNLKK